MERDTGGWRILGLEAQGICRRLGNQPPKNPDAEAPGEVRGENARGGPPAGDQPQAEAGTGARETFAPEWGEVAGEALADASTPEADGASLRPPVSNSGTCVCRQWLHDMTMIGRS